VDEAPGPVQTLGRKGKSALASTHRLCESS
jgi:hypothetical protein